METLNRTNSLTSDMRKLKSNIMSTVRTSWSSSLGSHRWKDSVQDDTKVIKVNLDENGLFHVQVSFIQSHADVTEGLAGTVLNTIVDNINANNLHLYVVDVAVNGEQYIFGGDDHCVYVSPQSKS